MSRTWSWPEYKRAALGPSQSTAVVHTDDETPRFPCHNKQHISHNLYKCLPIITGPPNRPVLFCSPAFVVVVCNTSGGQAGHAGGRAADTTAGQSCYVPLGRHLVIVVTQRSIPCGNVQYVLCQSNNDATLSTWSIPFLHSLVLNHARQHLQQTHLFRSAFNRSYWLRASPSDSFTFKWLSRFINILLTYFGIGPQNGKYWQ